MKSDYRVYLEEMLMQHLDKLGPTNFIENVVDILTNSQIENLGVAMELDEAAANFHSRYDEEN